MAVHVQQKKVLTIVVVAQHIRGHIGPHLGLGISCQRKLPKHVYNLLTY